MLLTQTTPAQRVLTITELLDIIFTYCDRELIPRNALVCKHWSEVALDQLWRQVDDLRRLFKLLAPINASGDEFQFTRPLEPEDWHRFGRYAVRVRFLRVISHENDTSELRLWKHIFAQVGTERPTANLTLLPKLVRFAWVTDDGEDLAQARMFMHENVRHLELHIPHETSLVPSFLRDVASRMPLLHTFDLRMMQSVRSIQSDLCTFLGSLTHLKRVILPCYFTTSEVISALSQLPHLRVVVYEYFSHQGKGDRQDVTQFSPALTDGAFPTLNDISLSVRMSDAQQFVENRFFPTNLTSLHIQSPFFEAPDIVHLFLSTVIKQCSLLNYLGLEIVIDGHNYNDPELDITFEHLRPALKLGRLTNFHFEYNRPLVVSNEDIEAIATHWPNLEYLMLNSAPVPYRRPQVTLDALLSFAEHCPKLHELGLFMDARETNIPTPKTPFRNLRSLSVGSSYITSAEPVALFLSELCPVGCLIEFGESWAFAFENAQVEVIAREALAEHAEEWACVQTVLPIVTRLRIEERLRMKALQKEVEDLRTRVRIYEDRAKAYGVEGTCVAI